MLFVIILDISIGKQDRLCQKHQNTDQIIGVDLININHIQHNHITLKKITTKIHPSS
jgi:hypothetical protein